jgi:UDP-N-acetylmuramate dehydrogenase
LPDLSGFEASGSINGATTNPMESKENIPLAPYTTFKIGGPARWFCVVQNIDDVKEAVQFAKSNNVPFFVLGGGSNVVVSDEGFNGLVMHPEMTGIEIVAENDQFVHYKVAAGENWDKFVAMMVEKGLYGIENLSHIPGNTGAVAVQNVGAYGQEASQVIEEVEVFDTRDNEVKTISAADCNFSYRKSNFNCTEKGRYIILSTVFKLHKNGQLNLSYRDLKEKFEGKNPTLTEIRNEVIEIRNRKFPFPKEAKNGNAGSFFKNTTTTEIGYGEMRNKVVQSFGEEIATKMDDKIFRGKDEIKIPSAFLIDICGLKNTEVGGAAINENQPLVIINQSGMATAADVVNLATKIKDTVFEKTGVVLVQEPELIGHAEGRGI